MSLHHFRPSPAVLSYDALLVITDAGYPDRESAGQFIETIGRLNDSVMDCLEIQTGYLMLQDGSLKVNREQIMVENEPFETGRIIASQLSGADSAALFAATLGEKFEDWMQGIFQENPAAGYFADLLGSIIIESVADWVEQQVQMEAARMGIKLTNRFSPGYCGWNVSEQHKLFQKFPSSFCGIHLTEKALMIPRKSVSGLIGLGNDVQKKDYPCNRCTRTQCYKRKDSPSPKNSSEK